VRADDAKNKRGGMDQAGTEVGGKKTLGRPFERGAANPRNRPGSGSGAKAGQKYSGTIVKEAVLSAFDSLGREKYLMRLARSKKGKHMHLFTALLAKVIPNEIVGKDGGPIELHVLHIATEGLSRLSDDELIQFHALLVKIGVNEVVAPAANDAAETALSLVPEAAAG
jgi:hypothetical protein